MWILQQNRKKVENSQSKARRLVLHLEEKGYSKKESNEMVYWRWEEKWIAEKRWWIDNSWKETQKGLWFTEKKQKQKEVFNPFKNEYNKRIRGKGKI